MIAEQAVLLLTDLDRAPAELSLVSIGAITTTSSIDTYLGNEDTVARLDRHGHPLAVLVKSTRANGEDLGLVQLLDGALRQEDAGRGLRLSLDPLDENAVQERNEGLDRSEGSLDGRTRVSRLRWVERGFGDCAKGNAMPRRLRSTGSGLSQGAYHCGRFDGGR